MYMYIPKWPFYSLHYQEYNRLSRFIEQICLAKVGYAVRTCRVRLEHSNPYIVFWCADYLNIHNPWNVISVMVSSWVYVVYNLIQWVDWSLRFLVFCMLAICVNFGNHTVQFASICSKFFASFKTGIQFLNFSHEVKCAYSLFASRTSWMMLVIGKKREIFRGMNVLREQNYPESRSRNVHVHVNLIKPQSSLPAQGTCR